MLFSRSIWKQILLLCSLNRMLCAGIKSYNGQSERPPNEGIFESNFSKSDLGDNEGKTQDMEMKDHQTPSHSICSAVPSTLQHLYFVNFKEIASLIETGSYTKEARRMIRAVRLTFGLRRKLTAPLLFTFLDFALQPGSEAHTRLSSFLPKGKEGVVA
ncbi:hypothetical protein PTKIN_Ptkin11bG0147400 [Pterospermum kingtungense]